MTDPSVISKILSSRPEIERCILLATPESLKKARDGLGQSKVISEADRDALSEIIRGVSAILYPGPKSPTAKKSGIIVRGGTDSASGFFVEKNLNGVTPAYSASLTQLVEASLGKIFASPKGTEGSYLTEILPALAIFRSTDKEVARDAIGYAVRFTAAGGPESVIPKLAAARFDRISGDLTAAYVAYRSLLDAYPSLWPARLALGQISLDIDQPVNALNWLESLVAEQDGNPEFLEAYTTALYRNDRLSEAEYAMRKSLEYEPNSGSIALIGAHILLDRNDYSAAQPLLEVASRKKSGDRMYLYLRAVQSRGLNRNDEAIRWARKGLQAYPTDPEIMVLLAGGLFAGPESGHEEAKLLCEEARKLLGVKQDRRDPLQTAMREEAEGEAARYLMLDAYSHQDWYAAASILETSSQASLDKSMVATILRKSGRTSEAVSFTSQWFGQAPASEDAVEAYLRSLAAAATKSGLASAGMPGKPDVAPTTPGLPGIGSLGSLGLPGEASIVGLVLQLLSGSYSERTRSYLLYLRGTLQSDPDQAIDSYRLALLERADNVEALAALARTYSKKGDSQKALYYLRQAKAIGIVDVELLAEMKALETSLSAQ
jgi:tetratricopeptide (TPR) repeat protein